MEKDKLIELSKQYFDRNKDLKVIFASSDGNFFYTESDAYYHVARTGLKKYDIKKEDAFPPKKTVEKPKKVTKQDK